LSIFGTTYSNCQSHFFLNFNYSIIPIIRKHKTCYPNRFRFPFSFSRHQKQVPLEKISVHFPGKNGIIFSVDLISPFPNPKNFIFGKFDRSMALLIRSPEISTLPKFFCNPSPRNPKSFIILRNNGKAGSRGRVRVSGMDQGVSLYGQFSAPVKRGSKPSKEEEEKQNYYVNVGYAIRALREEFPEVFYRELSYDIYRYDFFFIFYFLISSYVCCICNLPVWLLKMVDKKRKFSIFLLFSPSCFYSIESPVSI
jgi:hypothetical protein